MDIEIYKQIYLRKIINNQSYRTNKHILHIQHNQHYQI